MYSSILDCPLCDHRFNFEHDVEKFPADICCPSCGKSSPFDKFSAVILCPQCRIKLKVPLDIRYDADLLCPECSNELNRNKISLEESDYGSTYDGSEHPQVFKRILQDGDVFDKYRIIRLLGRGGMAEVYLAEHLLLKQLCALKLMRSGNFSDDPVYVKRFLREAKLSHQLDHPNIIKVYDVGNDFKTGNFFIAMEYIEGRTLLEIAHEQHLDEEYLRIVLYSIASALKCLADANVVHRDIKPSNIMLNNDGIFKLMDLGIAKSESNHQAGEMTLTMEQSAIGTPSYASPEQCRSAHEVDIRSDIYSLGATLYHAASGKLPYDGSTAVEIILKVVQGNAEPLKNLRPDLSDNFLDIIGQMMKKDPEERPASPDALMAMLTAPEGGWQKKLARGLKKTGKLLLKSPKQSGKSSVSRIIRAVFAVILLVVIAVNFKHLHNYYQERQNQTEKNRTGSKNTAGGESSRKNIAKPRRSPLDGKYPIINYPDAGSEFPSRRSLSNGKWLLTYPQISNAELPADSEVLEYDFHTGKPDHKLFDPALISDGVLHLDRLNSHNIDGKYISNARLPIIDLKNGFTLSLTFRIPPDISECTVFSSHILTLQIYKQRLLLTSQNYYIYPEINLLPGQWINLTISCDCKSRKITLFSGNAFLGNYLLKKILYSTNTIFFYGGSRSAGLQIDWLKLCNRSLTPVFPPRNTVPYIQPEINADRHRITPTEIKVAAETTGKISAETPIPQTTPVKTVPPAAPAVEKTVSTPAPSPAPVKSRTFTWAPPENSPAKENVQVDILDYHLNSIRKKYRKFADMCRRDEEKQNERIRKLTWRQALLYQQIFKQQQELRKQFLERIEFLEKRNKKIRHVKSRKYSVSAGKKLQQAFREHTARRRDWGFNRSDIEFSRKLQDMLKNRSVDPNIMVMDGTYHAYNGPLIKSLTSGRIQEKDKLFQILVDRGADPTALNEGRAYNASTQPPLIRYGLPAGLLDTAMNNLSKLREHRLDDLESLCKILFFDGAEFSVDHLIAATIRDRKTIVSLILASGFDPNARDKNGETALFYTYRMDGGENIRKLLIAMGADPDIRNNKGKKAVHYADVAEFHRHWKKNNLAECRKFFVRKFDPDTVLSNGSTLLTDACKNGELPKLQLLMSFKADVNKVDENNISPMQALFTNFRGVEYSLRSKRKSINYFQMLFKMVDILVDAGADLSGNPQGYGGKQLNFYWYFIIQCNSIPGSLKMALHMLPHTKNFEKLHWENIPYALSRIRESAWDRQIKRKILDQIPEEYRSRYVHIFLYYGCKTTPGKLSSKLVPRDVNWLCNIAELQAAVPMLYAAVCGRQPVEVIKVLLDSGADVNWKNRNGKTAYDVAGDPEVKELLRKARRR